MPLSHEAEYLLSQVISPLPLSRVGMDLRFDLDPANASLLFPDAPHPIEALAGLALRLGDWETAHTLAQDLSGREGSYWHAIIHRMEPDASNAGYWFRRVASHPIFPSIRNQAAIILDTRPETSFKLAPLWEPDKFTRWIDDLLKTGRSNDEAAARAIQEAEIRTLFQYCSGTSTILHT